MSDERRYSEAELRAIIQRAAKRQESARQAQDASEDGLTLTELQQIGEASGIDPAHIASAAAELDVPPPLEGARVLGAPTEVERVRLLPHPITDAAWARIVAEVREAFGSDGSVGEIGPVREWTATAPGRSRQTTMRLVLEPVEAGGTRVAIRQSVREQAKGLAIATAVNGGMALLFLALAASGADADLWMVGLFMAGIALVLGGFTRGWLEYWERQKRKELARLLDRFELIAREEAAAAPREAVPAARGEAASGGRLDLESFVGDTDEARGTARNRTRS